MIVCYVAIPSRLIGVKPAPSRRDKLTASAVGGALGVVYTPPYVLGRVAILMLGSPSLLIPGIVLLAFGATLQAGATGAVKTVKLSAKLQPAENHDPRTDRLNDPDDCRDHLLVGAHTGVPYWPGATGGEDQRRHRSHVPRRRDPSRPSRTTRIERAI